ncbi:DNA repair protein RadC [Candidatus Woesearchaeota archaeon]|nr:DNA repair protein RadC [Candidatus Woesearchaeota archaeon]
MKLLQIPEENRPRERLQKLGVGVLSEAELLAIILQKGTRQENVLDVSNRLISKYGIENLSGLSLKELQSIKGIGTAKATQIKAAFELSKRCSGNGNSRKPIVTAQDVYDCALPRLQNSDREQFLVIMLDGKNRVIKIETVSIGILNASIVHPREVFKSAIKESANSIILVHNHPSGDPSPSEEDKIVTGIFKEAGRLLNIHVLDHVIIGKGDYYNFAKGETG